MGVFLRVDFVHNQKMGLRHLFTYDSSVLAGHNYLGNFWILTSTNTGHPLAMDYALHEVQSVFALARRAQLLKIRSCVYYILALTLAGCWIQKFLNVPDPYVYQLGVYLWWHSEQLYLANWGVLEIGSRNRWRFPHSGTLPTGCKVTWGLQGFLAPGSVMYSVEFSILFKHFSLVWV